MTKQANHEEICDRLVQFISHNLLAEGVSLDASSSLTKLGLDSFSLIEILLFVERQYGIAITMDKLNRDNTETVDALAGVVHTEMAGIS